MPKKSESVSASYSQKYSPSMGNKSQKKAWAIWDEIDVLFLLGDAGTGKTYAAASLAMREVHKGSATEGVFLVRPAVEATGERLGFLPGTLNEKLGPFLTPVQCEIDKICDTYQIERPKVTYLPVGYSRGRNIDNAVLVIDEAQNLTYEQMCLIFSRICKGTKCIVAGSLDQCDIRDSFLLAASEALPEASDRIAVIQFDPCENMRHELVPVILKAMKEKKESIYLMSHAGNNAKS